MQSTATTNALPRATAVALPAMLFYLMGLFGLLGNAISYIALTVLLVIYVVREAMVIRALQPQRWLINPAVFCGLLTFMLAYGATNIIYFAPVGVRGSLGLDVEITAAMVKIQFLALVAAMALFVGYWSPLAEGLIAGRAGKRLQEALTGGLDIPRYIPIIILLAMSVIVRFFAISQGLYGYGGDNSLERTAETAAYSQYVSIGIGTGALALSLAAMSYYTMGRNAVTLTLMWGCIFVELFFGVLSGMKSAFVMPFIIPIVCSYLARGSVSKGWFIFFFSSIMLAYAIVEPFRTARNNQIETLTSSAAIIEVLLSSADEERQAVASNVGWRVVARSNVSYVGSIGVQFADDNEVLSSTAPAFLEDMFLAPLHAVIPRLIWTSKPLGDLGGWYTKEVIGHDYRSSTGMGPLTYLYFAGGFAAVAIFFFLLGILHRWLWATLRPWERISGAVIFLALLATVANVDSSVDGAIINLVRNSVMILLLSRLLFRRAEGPTPSSLQPRYA